MGSTSFVTLDPAGNLVKVDWDAFLATQHALESEGADFAAMSFEDARQIILVRMAADAAAATDEAA
jgi:hypothetical protein